GTPVTVAAPGAVSTVPSAGEVVGGRVAMLPVASGVTVAGTFAAAPAARKVTVPTGRYAELMGLLNVAETVVVSGTPVAPFGGAWAVTVGAALVVTLPTRRSSDGVPATSVTVAATVAV